MSSEMGYPEEKSTDEASSEEAATKTVERSSWLGPGRRDLKGRVEERVAEPSPPLGWRRAWWLAPQNVQR